ncbi:MAG: putative Ig domain-containing protein [Acidobacteriaceae bacterium]
MRRRFLPAFLPLFLLLVVGLTGCGGSSKPITVSINTPASTTIDPGDAVTLSVTVDNDNAGEGVTWTLTGTGCTGSACGALSGNTTTGVTYTAPSSVTTAFTVTITATSVKTPSVTNTVTLNIPANPAITTALGALTAGEVGSAYTVTVDLSGGLSPYTWTVKSGNLPTGLTLGSSTGTISGTPSASGNYTFTLQVTDSGTPTALTASGTFTIDIAAAPAIVFSTSSLPSSVLGDTYSGQVTATGGAGTITYAVTTGTLPAGLSISASGAITGKSTAAGTSSFTVTASDNYGDSAKEVLAITIDPVISVGAVTLPTGYPGSAYPATTLSASGGLGSPYTWTWAAATGSLPAGLNLSSAGVISGSPTTGGSYSVVVTAKDSGGNAGSATLTLTVESTLTITTATTLPAGESGSTAYSQQLMATGGSGSAYTWTTNSAGTSSLLTLSLALQSSGQITTVGPSPTSGTATFTATVTDSLSHTASATFTVTIYANLQITSGSTTGYVGAAYSKTETAQGGLTPYTWSWAGGAPNSLPPGLSISSAGLVSGTPTTAGTYVPLLTVKDSLGFTSSLGVGITIDPAVSVTTTSLPTAYPGVAYPATTLAATGGAGTPYTWTWAAASGSSLPAGLTLSGAGVITGMPTTAGTYNVVVTAKDSAANTGSATFSIVVGAALSITSSTTLPGGEIGNAYSQQLAATGGTGAPYTWSTNGAGTTSLQSVGLALASTGLVSNSTTLTSGTATFTATVTDSLSHTASAAFTVKVYAAVSVTTTTLSGYVGTPLTAQLAATGGDAPYTWSWSGAIPAGLSLSASGAITGTPTMAGPFAPMVTVKDAAGFSTAQTVNVTINAGVSVTTNAVPPGYAGAAYTSTTLAATGGAGAPYTWTWAAAPNSSLPAGLNLSTAGTITGTPTTAGTYSVVVTAKDSASNIGFTTITLVVEAKLTFTPTTLPTGAVSEVYPSTTLAPSGGTGSGYTFAATGLPPGLTLSGTGLLSGTPTTQGTYSSVVVTLTDSASHTSNTTLSITINASLAITTSSPMPYATVGASYSQQLAAAGGTGTLTWTATSSNLGGFALSLSGTGLVSGTPNGSGTVSFTANVKDGSGATATVPLTFQVYGLLQQNAGGFTFTGTTGVPYSGTISGTGGSGNYCWVVTGLSDGLTAPANNAPCGYVGFSITVSGVPTSVANVVPTFKLIDTTTNLAVSSPYAIVITNPALLTLPTPNPNTLPSATINQSYNGQINAAGGVGPTYTWTVNSIAVPTNGSLVAESDGLSVSSTGGPTLFVSGTPGSTGSVPLSVSVTDSASQTAGPDAYSVAVNAVSQISGQIQLTNSCGPVTLPPVTLTLSTTPAQTTTSDSNGNFSFSNVPSGTYTITPSITGPSSVFYPSVLSNVQVVGNTIAGLTIYAQLGYTVSGNIESTGVTDTGTTYISLQYANCGGGYTGNGTSIPEATLTAGGAFSIHGVPPGTYNLYATMDTLGTGQPNAVDPSGTSGATVTVSSADVTGVVDTLITPTVAVPTSTPSFQAINGANDGVVILYGAIKSSNGVEQVSSYDVQWSTTSTFTSTSSYSFPANGTGTDVWILNNGLANMTGSFTNGQAYYFRTRGNTSAGHGPWAVYGGSTPATVKAGANATGFTVTGTVTLSSGITIAPTAVLYAGFYNPNTGAIYADRIASPSNATPNGYSVVVPSGTAYVQFAILDQLNIGIVGPNDPNNTNNNGNNTAISITAGMTGVDESLSGANSTATVTTQYYHEATGPSTTQTGYFIAYNIRGQNKLPVAVELTSGPNIINPIDFSNYCQGCGHPQFQGYANIVSDNPNVGDTYKFLVTYSDGTSETVSTALTGWNGTSSVGGAANLPTNLAPSGTTTNTTPTFTWTYPANASDYTYQFVLAGGNNGQIWAIPGPNSNVNGFTSAQIPQPAGLVWNDDPTESGNSPTVSPLTSGDTYTWQLQVQDSYGNEVMVSVQFVP